MQNDTIYDIPPAVMRQIEDRADALCESLFEMTRSAFGWVANTEFRSATRARLLSNLITMLLDQHKRGYYDGYMKRHDSAQAQQNAWMGALLEGALKVSPKADFEPSAPEEDAEDAEEATREAVAAAAEYAAEDIQREGGTAYDRGWRAYLQGELCPPPPEQDGLRGARAQRRLELRGGWLAAQMADAHVDAAAALRGEQP